MFLIKFQAEKTCKILCTFIKVARRRRQNIFLLWRHNINIKSLIHQIIVPPTAKPKLFVAITQCTLTQNSMQKDEAFR